VNNVLTGTRQRTRRVFTRSGARTVRSVDDPLTLADRWQLAVCRTADSTDRRSDFVVVD